MYETGEGVDTVLVGGEIGLATVAVQDQRDDLLAEAGS